MRSARTPQSKRDRRRFGRRRRRRAADPVAAISQCAPRVLTGFKSNRIDSMRFRDIRAYMCIVARERGFGEAARATGLSQLGDETRNPAVSKNSRQQRDQCFLCRFVSHSSGKKKNALCFTSTRANDFALGNRLAGRVTLQVGKSFVATTKIKQWVSRRSQSRQLRRETEMK